MLDLRIYNYFLVCHDAGMLSDTREHVTFYAFILRLSLHMQCAWGKYTFNG